LVPYEWNLADGKIASVDPVKAVANNSGE